MAEDIIFSRTDNAIMEFTEYVRSKEEQGEVRPKEDPNDNFSPEEFVHRAIVLGDKSNLIENIDMLLKTNEPLEIISSVLMGGMDEVGELFGDGKLIVTEVLQSAEVMKTAINKLEPLLPQTQTKRKKKILLATVKGDVHDIGKNLVDIIFTSNGYEVINLGIKIDNPTLIKAIEEHQPDAIGLSGLLIKSAKQMVLAVEDFSSEQISIPVLVGGAALTRKFAEQTIAPAYEHGQVYYAKDAMQGLSIVKTIFS